MNATFSSETREKMASLYGRLRTFKKAYHRGEALTEAQQTDVAEALTLAARMDADDAREVRFIGRLGRVEAIYSPFDLEFRSEAGLTAPEIVTTFEPTRTRRTREEKLVASFFFG